MALLQWKNVMSPLIKSGKFMESSQTDFVLVYQIDDNEFGKLFREKFFTWIQSLEINMKETQMNDKMIVELNVPLYLLCFEGTRDGLKVNTKYPSSYKDLLKSDCAYCCFWRCFESESFSDRLSVALDQNNVQSLDFQSPYLFRSSTRFLITYYILNSSDLVDEGSGDDLKVNAGLNFMLNKKYITDAFPMHEIEQDGSQSTKGSVELAQFTKESSSRNDLYKAWRKMFRLQPVHSIRDYFGTHIALYFAWCDILSLSLCIPMIVGVITFIYGFKQESYYELLETNQTNRSHADLKSYVNMFKESFDNDLMPAYAVVVTLWGTIFLELWKRENAKLAYLWDVKSFEDKEPDRPQYTSEQSWNVIIRSFWVRCCISTVISIFMVGLVLVITASLIVYRVVMTVDYCSSASPISCLVVSDMVALILNSLAIIILGKIYRKVAYKLTVWENYRCLTEFNDALIYKMFAFEFANSYTACFYIAFFRRSYERGIFGLGKEYNDSCQDVRGKSCMPMLSMQIFLLMVITPLPKFFSDFLFPFIKKRYFNKNKVSDESSDNALSNVEEEYLKEPLDDFTMSEYTEKVLLYGYLMLFAASFPLAPLIAMLTLIVDVRIDAHRLLFVNRRPIPFVAEDIGMWYDILNFINVVGVVANACLIAFTSRWGERLSFSDKLVFVLIFENVVFALKYLIAIIIPDVPRNVKRAKRMDLFKSGKMISKINVGRKKRMSKYS